MKTITETMWVCVKNNEPLRASLEYTRKESIKSLVKGTSYPWVYWKKKYGWRCIKVKGTIEAI